MMFAPHPLKKEYENIVLEIFCEVTFESWRLDLRLAGEAHLHVFLSTLPQLHRHLLTWNFPIIPHFHVWKRTHFFCFLMSWKSYDVIDFWKRFLMYLVFEKRAEIMLSTLLESTIFLELLAKVVQLLLNVEDSIYAWRMKQPLCMIFFHLHSCTAIA